MSQPDSNAVLKLLRVAADFTKRVGATSEAVPLEDFCKRFESEKLTFKLLRGPVDQAMTQASIKIREIVLDECRDPRTGQEALAEEYTNIWVAFNRLEYPPEWSDLNISSFPGSEFVKEKVASYKGDPSGVGLVVERTVEVIRRYSDLIGRGDFDGAYSLTATGLQEWMSKKRFVTEHEQAAKQYHGPALEFHIERFQFVYADAAARAKSKADEGWPKTTPKEERRSCVTGFWIRDRSNQTGCWGGFLFTEEKNEYRIAKFTFFTQ